MRLAGETERWRSWLRRHGRAIVLFARQWSLSSADAEDAAQEGFLKFWRTRSKARDPVPYLYACVRSAAMDLGRSHKRRDARENAAARPEQSLFELPLENAERQLAIEIALRQLPGDQREVIVMKIWGELTFAQIGQALGIPMNTAVSRYRYALARLETELSQEKTCD